MPSVSIANTQTFNELEFEMELTKCKDAKEMHFEGNSLAMGYYDKFGKQWSTNKKGLDFLKRKFSKLRRDTIEFMQSEARQPASAIGIVDALHVKPSFISNKRTKAAYENNFGKNKKSHKSSGNEFLVADTAIGRQKGRPKKQKALSENNSNAN